MQEDQKKKIIELIQETFGVEEAEEISPDSEFISDLNGSLEEIQTVIKLVEEEFDIELEISQDLETLSVQAFFESIEEAFI